MIDSKAVVQAHNLFMTFKAENKNSADISAIVDLNMQIKRRTCRFSRPRWCG